MAQLNIYVPDDLEEKIRRKAQREGKSVSALVVEAVRQEVEPASWSREFLALLESEGVDFPEVADEAPQKRPVLDHL